MMSLIILLLFALATSDAIEAQSAAVRTEHILKLNASKEFCRGAV
jgi:hypothetical protein